jgi:hypothetical protein
MQSTCTKPRDSLSIRGVESSWYESGGLPRQARDRPQKPNAQNTKQELWFFSLSFSLVTVLTCSLAGSSHHTAQHSRRSGSRSRARSASRRQPHPARSHAQATAPIRKRITLFFERFSLWLSRACPGKIMIFSIKMASRKRHAFSYLPESVRVHAWVVEGEL